MVKFLALVCVVAVMTPSLLLSAQNSSQLGRPVSEAEAAQLVGGACAKPSQINCSQYSCGTGVGCVGLGLNVCAIVCETCSGGCLIWNCAIAGCAGS